ncbi:MAG: lysophospholipid acyltransferase family protein [Xanthomonadales bacterium]|nr:lysophospholipid acyltransferase family protein [Xanthomonadales bacterium]
MGFAVFSLLVRIISFLPARVLEWLSHPLGRLTWWISPTKRASTRRNLSCCFPGMPDPERERLARRSIRHYAMVALETGMAWYWGRARLESRFSRPEGMKHLQQAAAAGKGVVILVPHFGSWELLNLWLCCRMDMTSLYKPGRYREFEEKLLKKRQRFGGTMAPTNRAGIRTLVQALRNGGHVLILPDQDPSEGQGRFAPFFGIQAYTPVLASRLCQQTGARAVVSVCRRLPGGRYRTHFLPVEDAFYDADLDFSTAAMNRSVEASIAIDPAQYLWAYKRFKTRPEGEPRFYARP